MRVAVVDIGTNSTRLLIAEVEDGGGLTELERRTTVTRLGQGVDRTGALAEEAMGRVFATLDDYRKAIDALGAETTVGVLTSAVRDASNGAGFAAVVRERYGLDARTIPGELEAQLSFLGATSERDHDEAGPVVVIDIGGGSTELVVGTGRDVSFFVSTQAGVVRQTERHIHHDPPRPDELQAVANEVREIFERSVPGDVRNATVEAIAVAGTATSLAAIHQELDRYDATKVHGYHLSLPAIAEMLQRLARMPEAERRGVRGLHPDRAPTIVAGTILLSQALEAFGLQETEISEHDILYGAALEAVHRTPPHRYPSAHGESDVDR